MFMQPMGDGLHIAFDRGFPDRICPYPIQEPFREHGRLAGLSRKQAIVPHC